MWTVTQYKYYKYYKSQSTLSSIDKNSPHPRQIGLIVKYKLDELVTGTYINPNEVSIWAALL